jgi:uncharacterized protein (TIGR01370 family)
MLGSRNRREWITAAIGALSSCTGVSRSTAATRSGRTLPASIRWLAFYGERVDEAAFSGYDIVVLDPGFHGSIPEITAAGSIACGYLSLCEIRTSDPGFPDLDRSVLLEENPAWPGVHRVDIRKQSWGSFVLENKIPSIDAMGFNGLMFDTLDTASYLESTNPSRYGGMRAAAIDLVRRIRARWPGSLLIMNRGYDLLPNVIQEIDALIAESFMTSPAPNGGFSMIDGIELERRLFMLSPAKKRSPPLPVLSLDYWDPDDLRMITQIYRRERELGHHPYVATRLLDRIVPEAV